MDEENFPRGGTTTKDEFAVKEHDEDPDLFKTKEAKKKKSKLKGDNAEPEGKRLKQQDSTHIAGHLAPLKYNIITPGMLLLGSVKSVKDYSIEMGFANGISGTVSITSVADAYRDQLQKLANAAQGDKQDIEDLDIHSLHELFKVGMIMPCKVLKANENKKGKRVLKLTVNPKEINSQLTAANVKNGLALYGNVASQEDHGYVVDIGVPGLSAFLRNADAEKFIHNHNDDYPLRVGQPLLCMIETDGDKAKKTGENRSVNITIDPEKLKHAQVNDKVVFQSLVPGMKMKVRVKQITSEGAIVNFLKYDGGITNTHLRPNISTQTEVDAVILSVNHTTKVVSLTTLSHLVKYNGVPVTNQFSPLTRGTIIEDAVVQKSTKDGVHFKLTNSVRGKANKKNLSDTPVQNIKEEFPQGEKFRCRVMYLDPIDNLAVVSLKESVLRLQYLVINDIKPGTIVEGKMEELKASGIRVKITDYITGFIPNMHLADVPLKHPEKIFEAGKKVKCLVLTVDDEKKSISLSNKKSLKTSKYPVLTSYSQLQLNKIVEGFIAQVCTKGCLVIFCNNIKGWVPLKEMSTERIHFPEKVFYTGQVVRCRVLSWSEKDHKISLSFKVPMTSTAFGTKSVEVPEDFKVGKLLDCKVMKKTSQGLDVELLQPKIPAFLPVKHLSDNWDDCFLLRESYSPGTVIRDVVYVGCNNFICVSNRMSLKVLAQEDQLITEFDQLQPGLMVPGSVKRLMKFGIFVELPGPHVGLVPLKYTTDQFVPDLRNVYSQGQSVIVKVTECDAEKQRFLGSLRMTDCYHGDTDVGLNLLRQHLKDMETVRSKLHDRKDDKAKLAELQVGQIHKVTITKVAQQGALCELPNGVKGLITTEQIGDKEELKEGDVEEAVILFVDMKDGCIELSLSSTLVKLTKRRNRGKYNEAKEGQLLRCDVLLVKPSLILVMLKGHAKGALAYLPAKRHVNDVLEVHQFCVGQSHPVIVKHIDNDKIICSMQVHEKRREKELEGESGTYSVESHALETDTICMAVIKKVHPLQMNVSVNNVPGRIHVTEILDDFKDGDNPTSAYKEDMEVKVKIIGFREAKSHRFLPITHKKVSKSLPECSLKHSKLSHKLKKKDYVQDTNQKYEVGDSVKAFVLSYENHVLRVMISPVSRGWVYFLNLTDDLELLKKPGDHFLTGQGYHAKVVNVTDKGTELSFTGRKEMVRKGVTTKGWITELSKAKGLKVSLAEGYRGSVSLTDLQDVFTDEPLFGYKFGQFVKCYVYSVDKESKKCHVSLRASRITGDKTNIKDPEISSLSELFKGQILRGFVTAVSGKYSQGQLNVCIGHNISGTVPYCNISDYKIENLKECFHVGQCVTAKILVIEGDKVTLSLKDSDIGHDAVSTRLDIKHPISSKTERKRKSEVKLETPSPKKKSKDDITSTSGHKERKHKLDVKTEVPSPKKKAKTGSDVTEPPSVRKVQSDSDTDSGLGLVKDEKEGMLVKSGMSPAPRLEVSAGFSWDADISLSALQNSNLSSDSDSSDSEDVAPKKTKKTKAEIRMEKKEAENKLFKLEQSKLSGDVMPQTVDDFDCLVVSSPNSSLVWLQYMAFHLESAEIDKARAVAERGLKTISFREEQEKLNVWVAYLNLENMYATPDQLKKVLDRALQQNDVTKVYNQMINIYVQSGKMQEAESLYNVMTKRRKGDKETWIGFGLFYYKAGQLEDARKLMQRSLRSLEKQNHVEIIAKFAQMEYKHGEPERGKTLFENILSNYPKRTDLWSVYIDMVIKTGEVDNARNILERVIHLKLSTKKMKFFYKKYLDFEKAHGDSRTVETVKQKAMQFVESQGFVDD